VNVHGAERRLLRVCVAMLITEGNHYGSAQPGC
jgi:hypothetical protein